MGVPSVSRSSPVLIARTRRRPLHGRRHSVRGRFGEVHTHFGGVERPRRLALTGMEGQVQAWIEDTGALEGR